MTIQTSSSAGLRRSRVDQIGRAQDDAIRDVLAKQEASFGATVSGFDLPAPAEKYCDAQRVWGT